MNKRTLYYSVVVALAGFLFGFDTVVISGANLPIKTLWQTSDWFHGTFIMSSALWGTVIGSLFGGYPTDRYGRKSTLIFIGILYFISAIGSAVAPEPFLFSFFRFIGGIGVGISTIAAPAYTSEIASARSRGSLVAMYQFNIVLGILIAFISNYLLEGVGGINDWRWMLGIEALPAGLYILMMFGVPESPRWLIYHKGNHQKAKEIIASMNPQREAQQLYDELAADLKVHANNSESIFNKKYKKPLLLAFLLAFFNQMSGINFILYYAPEILVKAGFGSADSLFSSIFIGIVNLVFTLLGMMLIDRVGRRQLMYIGSLGYIVSLAMISFGFYDDTSALFKLSFILLFIASHAVGQGAVIWVFISEIFPNKVRSFGQAWGSGIHWIFAALITLFGSVLINAFHPALVFGFFALAMIGQLLFVAILMPETKGMTLEELQKKLT